MARFKAEMPTELMKVFSDLEDNIEDIFGEMTQAGAKVVHQNVVRNMKKSFKNTESLEKGLKITRVYKTPSDDGINTHIGFYGYDGVPTKKYPKGVPIPLKALAREYGTSRGEAKKPYFRKSFKKDEIEDAMLKIQEKRIGDG
ncbi:MAG: hypothetical protein IJ068_06825 [Bacilli bacterium]|nr:hypothetical protein [Bacilli bacterium]